MATQILIIKFNIINFYLNQSVTLNLQFNYDRMNITILF